MGPPKSLQIREIEDKIPGTAAVYADKIDAILMDLLGVGKLFRAVFSSVESFLTGFSSAFRLRELLFVAF